MTMDGVGLSLGTMDLDRVPKSVIIRSLRRRFWQAIRDEDGDRAYFIYRATKNDWNQLMATERQANQKKENKGRKKSKGIRSLRVLMKRGSSKESMDPIVSDSEAEASGSLLQTSMKPSDPFTLDDFKSPTDLYGEELDTVSFRSPATRKRRSARQVLQLRSRRQRSKAEEELRDIILDPTVDERMTTPLHEAARLGHVDLLSLMLDSPHVNPNMRNGMGRTSLHMAVGGVLETEILSVDSIEDETVGIRKPEAVELDEDVVEESKSQRSSSIRYRFKGRRLHSRPSPSMVSDNQKKSKGMELLDSCRIEAAALLLRWQQFGLDGMGETFSVNTVDSRGRTALHYAAELGRVLICQAILDKFGLLTIVDDQNKTPCDLAAANEHSLLADELEARSLLYMDPHGMDEILLGSVLTNDPHAQAGLVPPFSWFRTIDMSRVQEIREHRVNSAMKHMKKILECQAEKTKGIDEVEEGASASVYEDGEVPSGNDREHETSDAQEEVVKASTGGETETRTSAESISISAEDVEEITEPDGDGEVELRSEEQSVEDNEVSQSELGPIRDEVIGLRSQDSGSSLGSADLHQIVSNFESDGSPDYGGVFLHLHKGHVELYLKYHGWQIKEALVAFSDDPVKAFEAAEIADSVDLEGVDQKTNEGDHTCSVCFDNFSTDSKSWRTLSCCGHGFCVDCLESFIDNCAETRETGLVITCPYHNCGTPLTPLETVNLASNEAYCSLVETSNRNFIGAAEDVKFCPHPSCEGIIKLSLPDRVQSYGADLKLMCTMGAVCTAVQPKVYKSPVTYEGVCNQTYMDCHNLSQPPKAHRFCFSCGDEGIHWPVDCERLAKWKETIHEFDSEVKGNDGDTGDCEKFDDYAHKLWMKTNTRPCPKCKAPIEKDEGCNHMTCPNPYCKHEYCWICMKPWKYHSSKTGGFYRCNRWEDDKNHDFYDDPPEVAPQSTTEDIADTRSLNDTYGTAMHESRVSRKRSREVARYLHHYQRWNAHKDSAVLEHALGNSVCERMEPVVKAAIEFSGDPSFNFGGKGLSFVHAAFTELAECRSTLQHSYAFSYFRYSKNSRARYRLRTLDGMVTEKTAFEQYQGELETLTEQMSDVVGRSRLRATQSQITYLTSSASSKRKEFSSVIANIALNERKEVAAETEGELWNSGRVSGGNFSAIARRNDLADISDEDNGEEDVAHANIAQRAYDSDDDEELLDWACSACTFVNTGRMTCEICETPRPR